MNVFYLLRLSFISLLLGFLAQACQPEPASNSHAMSHVAPNHPHFRYTGRFDTRDSTVYRFAWTASQVEASFQGSSLVLLLGQESWLEEEEAWYQVQIDELPPIRFAVKEGERRHELANDLSEGPHRFRLFKSSEAETGIGLFYGLELAPGKQLMLLPARPDRRLEIYGNSITCGYGNEGESEDCPFSAATENGYLSYSAIAARELAAEYSVLAWSGRGVYQNYSGEREGTIPHLHASIVPGDSRRWEFSRWQPQVVLINLGTNDFAHGTPPKADFMAAYEGFVQQLRSHYPDAKIVLLSGPMVQEPVLPTLQAWLDEIVAQLNQAGMEELYRFDLSPQGDLGYGCSWHPNLAQHRKNADELQGFLAGLMNW